MLVHVAAKEVLLYLANNRKLDAGFMFITSYLPTQLKEMPIYPLLGCWVTYWRHQYNELVIIRKATYLGS